MDAKVIFECAHRVNKILHSSLLEEDGRLNAETYLAGAAAILGRSWQHATDDLEPEAKKNLLQQEGKQLFHLLKKSKPDSNVDRISPEVSQVFERLEKEGEKGVTLFLSCSDFHKPHKPPEQIAAMMWNDCLYVAEEAGLEAGILPSIAIANLAMIMEFIHGVIPDQVACALALETAVVCAWMGPIQESELPIDMQWKLSERSLAASNNIFQILFQQNESYEDRSNIHFETVAANAGALWGMMTAEAADLSFGRADYVVSADVDRFLEDGNIQIMASFINRGGDVYKLPEYGDYVENAAKSIGHDPYPALMVEKRHAPHAFPLFAAAMLRSSTKEICQQYNLTPWGTAAACLPAVNQVVRFGEHAGLSTEVSVKLMMSHAVAAARVKPLELDKKHDFNLKVEDCDTTCNRIASYFKPRPFSVRSLRPH